MRAALLVLGACSAPVVIGNRAPAPIAHRALELPRVVVTASVVPRRDPLAGCDATGCPMPAAASIPLASDFFGIQPTTEPTVTNLELLVARPIVLRP